MAHIPDTPIKPDDPATIQPRKVPAVVDMRRAIWIIIVAIAVSLVVAGLVRLLAPTQDPYLPESRSATGAEAPAIPVPPAR